MMDHSKKLQRTAWVLVSAILLTILPSYSIAQTSSRIVEVAVSGNVNINSEAILGVVSLKPGSDYSEAAANNDRNAITAMGYFSVVTVHKEDVSGGVKVVYEVTENPRITEIKVTGAEPLKAEDVLAVVKSKPGQVLNVDVINMDIQRIQDFYGSKGYFAYVMEPGIDARTGVITLPILVHKVESIEITGNKKTKSYVFLREMRTKPGGYFNREVFQKDMMRIWSLEILEALKDYDINPGSEIGLVKLVVPVVEKKTGTVGFGFGYSSSQRLVGQANVQDTNFQGKGQSVNLLWQQGTTEAIGGSASYEGSFYEPWIDKQHTSLNVSAFNKVSYRFTSGVFGTGTTFGDDKFYSERRKGGEITASRPLNEQVRVFVSGRSENVEADPGLLRNADGTVSNFVNIVQTGRVNTGSFRFVRNTRDVDIDPAAGGYDGVAFEFGSVDVTQYTDKDANGNLSPNPIPVPFRGGYSKTSLDLRRYFSQLGAKKKATDRRVTLAVRTKLGFASGKLPYFEQFFVGGSESLRGYREDRFWGTKMFFTNVELRYPISGITAVAFVDYGDAWGTASTFSVPEMPQHNNFRGNFGTGVGIRVGTPVGYIKLDYGIGNEGARTHFSMERAF